MTNKERQAKLQYLLNSLSMTKEQKDIVVDLVNSSGGNSGGGSGENDIVTIYIKWVPRGETVAYSITVDGNESEYVELTMQNNIAIVDISDIQIKNVLKYYILNNKRFVIDINNDTKIMNQPISLSIGSSADHSIDTISIVVGAGIETVVFIITGK